MKARFVLVALVAVVVGVSSAVAAPPPDKGKPETTGKPQNAGKPLPNGANCRPKVTVVLKGTLTSVSSEELGMDVMRSNRWGRVWAQDGTAKVKVDDTTKVRRNGKKTLDDLMTGDWLLVQARVCKADLLAEGDPPTLTAVRVVAHPVKA